MRGAVILELSDLLGRKVVSDGAELGSLADLGARLTERYPPITRLVAGRRKPHHFAWEDVRELGDDVVHLAPGASELSPELDGELLIRRDVLDCQIFDFGGKRLTRVGDVELALSGMSLRLVAVDVGSAAILRRLGLRMLAQHVQPQALDWEGLHVASARGHALQLDKPTAAVHRLSAEEVAYLVSRLPAVRGVEVLASVPPAKAARAESALAERHPPRRRFRKVMSLRRRAPA